MARCRQSIINFIPGIIVVFFITTIIFTALAALWIFAFENSEDGLYFDNYLWRVLSFTFLQAALSTVISVVCAVLLAKSIYQNRFYGKSYFLRILSITFVLPSLVVVIGILSIYGHHGWIAKLCDYFNIHHSWAIQPWWP